MNLENEKYLRITCRKSDFLKLRSKTKIMKCSTHFLFIFLSTIFHLSVKASELDSSKSISRCSTHSTLDSTISDKLSVEMKNDEPQFSELVDEYINFQGRNIEECEVEDSDAILKYFVERIFCLSIELKSDQMDINSDQMSSYINSKYVPASSSISLSTKKNEEMYFASILVGVIYYAFRTGSIHPISYVLHNTEAIYGRVVNSESSTTQWNHYMLISSILLLNLNIQEGFSPRESKGSRGYEIYSLSVVLECIQKSIEKNCIANLGIKDISRIKNHDLENELLKNQQMILKVLDYNLEQNQNLGDFYRRNIWKYFDDFPHVRTIQRLKEYDLDSSDEHAFQKIVATYVADDYYHLESFPKDSYSKYLFDIHIASVLIIKDLLDRAEKIETINEDYFETDIKSLDLYKDIRTVIMEKFFKEDFEKNEKITWKVDFDHVLQGAEIRFPEDFSSDISKSVDDDLKRDLLMIVKSPIIPFN